LAEADLNRYKIVATHKGTQVVFVVTAPSGRTATTEARRIYKTKGMQRILVNSVELPKT
jgi:hypothetical protein